MGMTALLWLAGGFVALTVLSGLGLLLRRVLGRSAGMGRADRGERAGQGADGLAAPPPYPAGPGGQRPARHPPVPRRQHDQQPRMSRSPTGTATLYCCDTSRNGTRIGGERLKTGEPTRITSGDLIHLGTQGTVIIIRAPRGRARPLAC